MFRVKQNGFTLVEMLITVAILAVMAAFAVPAYQNYIKRAYVAEGLQMSSLLQVTASDFYVKNGRFPHSNVESGAPEQITSKVVESIALNSLYNGVITITYSEKVSDIKDVQDILVLKPKVLQNGSIRWDCKTKDSELSGLGLAGNTTILDKYRPPECRTTS